jgi:hypothetical protein
MRHLTIRVTTGDSARSHWGCAGRGACRTVDERDDGRDDGAYRGYVACAAPTEPHKIGAAIVSLRGDIVQGITAIEVTRQDIEPIG